MNKEEKLILQNQKEILRALWVGCSNDEIYEALRKQHSKTSLALQEWGKK